MWSALMRSLFTYSAAISESEREKINQNFSTLYEYVTATHINQFKEA